MRKIQSFEIVVGLSWFAVSMLVGIGVGIAAHQLLPLTEYRAVFVVSITWISCLASNVGFVPLLLRLYHVPIGYIASGSAEERNYNIFLVYTFLILQPLTSGRFVPVPWTRPLYRLLGAQISENTYTAGTILDAQFVSLGCNTLLGNASLLVPHVIEGQRLAHYPIRIGNNVTVGAHSVIMSDVEIGDGAIVAMNSVVIKGTKIPAGEVWGGTPARRISLTESRGTALQSDVNIVA